MNVGSALLDVDGYLNIDKLHGIEGCHINRIICDEIRLGDVFTHGNFLPNYFYTVIGLNNDRKQIELKTTGESRFIIPYSKFLI